MNAYKAIGFDWGGVINGKPGGFSWQPLADEVGVSLADFEVAYFHHNQPFNRDEISARELWRRVIGELGHDVNDESFMDRILALHSLANLDDINEDVIGLLKILRANGYKLGLLSNNTTKGADHMIELGIDTYFDVFHVSAVTGFVKPVQKAFTHLADELGAPINELIFIDDTPKSLSSALEVGFTPILFTGYEQLLNDLANLGINTKVSA